MQAVVPVLMLTGPVGVGKSTVLSECARLLRLAGVPHAAVDLAGIGRAWPVPEEDRWNEQLIHRNLACMWANFRDAGAERLVLARVLEARSLLRHVESAVPGAAVTVVRLRASLPVLEARIRHREQGSDPAWYLEVAAYLVTALEQPGIADYVVDNERGPVADVAALALRLAGWLS
jgi:hypothetical protein